MCEVDFSGTDLVAIGVNVSWVGTNDNTLCGPVPRGSALVLVVALMTCAARSARASADHGAVAISPDETAMTGTAEDPRIEYGDVTVACDTGILAGATGVDSDVVDFELGFTAPCDVSDLEATVTCSGTAKWGVLTAEAAEIDRLNPGFGCEVEVTGICAIAS
jgi:hypothetical protein